MPSRATSDPSNTTDFLVERPEYTLSYNKDRGGPNWVSWQIRKQDLGSVDRSNEFFPDPDLPREWRIFPGDYTGSGYDRGHICPSGDRTNSKKANEATFSMANMLPQAANLNRECWADLENYGRELVRRGYDIYVTAGGYGSKGTIGKGGRVTVPARCWKVIVAVPSGASVPGSLTAETPVIAVDFPNEETVEPDWKRYATKVADIQKATGLTLLAALPPDLRAALEVKPSALTVANAAPTASSAARNPGPVIGNRKSKIYHLPGCPDYDRVSKENRVRFKSAEEAEGAGYRRAGNCS
jgi:endonuclease G, mitochondrial